MLRKMVSLNKYGEIEESGERRERENSDIVKALEMMPSYRELAGMEPVGAYKVIRQVERAYEQLQALGVDVSEQLRERRYQVLEVAFDALNCEIELSGLKEHVEKRDVFGFETFNPNTVEKAIALIIEYTRKIDPDCHEEAPDVQLSED
jgi:hypothetical protein